MREESLKYARKKKEIRQHKKEVFETPLTSQRERERERERERDALFAEDRDDALFFFAATTQFLLLHPKARAEKSWGNYRLCF